MKYVFAIMLNLLFSNVFCQSIVMDNKSTEDIEASYRTVEPDDSFNILSKGKSKTEGFANMSKLSGKIYWKYEGVEKIEIFEYDINILKKKFDEIHFVYLGEKQWCVRIFKNKKYTPEFQIFFNKGKQELVPLETQYSVTNKNETVLLVGIQVDTFETLYIGRANSSLLGHTIYFSRPKIEKRFKYIIKSLKDEYEDLEIDLKEIEISKVKCFDATIEDYQLELKVYSDYPAFTKEFIFSKKYDLKIKKKVDKIEQNEKK